MEFISNLKEEEYKKFWLTINNNHFLQSYGWGQAQEKNRKQKPYYVGLKDDKGKIVAAALLLKKELPFKLSYFYVPRGYTMDYTNKEVLKEFTEKIKEFIKEQNAIYLKLDPPIMYQELTPEAQIVENGKNNFELYEYFKSLGYIHKGFNKLYEGNQPRYTFRTYFDKYNSFEEIEKSFSSSFFKPVKRSYNYLLEIYESDEVKTFHDLIKLISSKDGFHEYSLDYYQNVYDELKKDNLIKIFNAKINPQKIITSLEEELQKEKKEERKTKIQKDIDYFNNLPSKDEYTCASLICTYTNTGAWSLYIGNDEVATYTGTVNRLYYEFIKDAYENKYEYIDLFGVVGDPNTKFKNLAGIYEYKRKIGGDLIEFIGEFDLVNKPFLYKILPTLLKIYRKIK